MKINDQIPSENRNFLLKGIGDRFVEILFGEKGLFKGNHTSPKSEQSSQSGSQPIALQIESHADKTAPDGQLLFNQPNNLDEKKTDPSEITNPDNFRSNTAGNQPPISLENRITLPALQENSPKSFSRFEEVGLNQFTLPAAQPTTSITGTAMLEGQQRIPPALPARETAKAKPPRLVIIDDFPRSQSLTASQKQWYGYWKVEVQNNRFPTTHMGYINLYAEELLERQGSKPDDRSINLVVSMWKNYRAIFPNLDYYLVPKIAHGYDASKQNNLAYAFWMDVFKNRQIGQIWAANPYLNAILQKALDDGKLSELPFGVWVQLCGHCASVGTNKFYQNQNANGEYDAVFIRAIMAVDAYCLKKYKKPFILRNNRRSRPQKAMGITYSYDFCSATPMIATVAAVIRFTENLLRKKMNMRLIKVEDVLLYQDIRDVIIGSMISYDPNRVSRILDESKEIADRLAPPPEDQPAVESSIQPQGAPSHPSLVDTAMFKPQVDTRAADQEAWSEFIQQINELEKNILTLMLKDTGTISPNQIEGFARQHGRMAETLMDSINEQALDTTGLLILYNEGEQWIIDAEAADHLRAVLFNEDQ